MTTFARACLSIFHPPRTRKVPCCPIGKVMLTVSVAFPFPRPSLVSLPQAHATIKRNPSTAPPSHRASFWSPNHIKRIKTKEKCLIVPGAGYRTIKVSGFRIIESPSTFD